MDRSQSPSASFSILQPCVTGCMFILLSSFAAWLRRNPALRHLTRAANRYGRVLVPAEVNCWFYVGFLLNPMRWIDMNWLQDELPSFAWPHIAFGVPFSNQLTYQAYQVSLYLWCLCSHKCSENLPVARSCKASTAVKQKDEEEAIGRRCCHCWYTWMYSVFT
jgi:hypothetical protein